jgi:uncharacterized protein (DUF4415 family)
MARTNRNDAASSKSRDSASAKGRSTAAAKTRGRPVATKSPPVSRPVVEPTRPAWATDLVFDVREPKLAVSLRLDADVLRFFRGLGAGYQTRINEVLKAFMQARGGAQLAPRSVVSARARSSAGAEGKRAR